MYIVKALFLTAQFSMEPFLTFLRKKLRFSYIIKVILKIKKRCKPG